MLNKNYEKFEEVILGSLLVGISCVIMLQIILRLTEKAKTVEALIRKDVGDDVVNVFLKSLE